LQDNGIVHAKSSGNIGTDASTSKAAIPITRSPSLDGRGCTRERATGRVIRFYSYSIRNSSPNLNLLPSKADAYSGFTAIIGQALNINDSFFSMELVTAQNPKTLQEDIMAEKKEIKEVKAKKLADPMAAPSADPIIH
jgi:hypothetical protein